MAVNKGCCGVEGQRDPLYQQMLRKRIEFESRIIEREITLRPRNFVGVSCVGMRF
jgi:hypothetical protein